MADVSTFYCTTRACRFRGYRVELPWREEPVTGRHYPLCHLCGNVMREDVEAPAVIWTGAIGQRYRDKDKAGYHDKDGITAWTRNTPDGKPKSVHLDSWSEVRDHCKREKLADPRELPRNMPVTEDGKGLGSGMGLPGVEV